MIVLRFAGSGKPCLPNFHLGKGLTVKVVRTALGRRKGIKNIARFLGSGKFLIVKLMTLYSKGPRPPW